MPKMKTHSGAKKRFKKTASGLIKRSKAFRRHHAWAKDTGSKLALRSTAYVHEVDAPRFKILLPN